MLDTLKSMRRSDLVIKLALIANAVFTFIFGYRYLPDLFTLFGVTPEDSGFEIMRVLAGAFLVVVTDGAFFAWGEMRNREGNSNEQIATCDTAKTWSLYGSLAATAGAFVLGQSAVEIPPGIVFVVSIVATAAAGVMAIMHVYWWDKYRGESFEASARANAAQDQADEMNDSRTRERKEFELQREKRRELHAIEMSELEKELELEKTRRMAQADIKRQMLEQEINHEREVAKLTGQILQDQVHQSAAAIAQRKARAARDRFIAGMGLPVEDFPEGSNGNGRR